MFGLLSHQLYFICINCLFFICSFACIILHYMYVHTCTCIHRDTIGNNFQMPSTLRLFFTIFGSNELGCNFVSNIVGYHIGLLS